MTFVRSGYVYLVGGYVGDTGYVGHNWSRTASSSTNARILFFNPTDINPSNNRDRWFGFPFR